MFRRRPFVVLLLLAALSVLALPAGVQTANGALPAPNSGPGATLAAETWSGPDAALVPPKIAGRQDAGTSQRVPGSDLVLLAVLALLAALPALGRGAFVQATSATNPRPARWSPISGRAPPLLQLAVH